MITFRRAVQWLIRPCWVVQLDCALIQNGFEALEGVQATYPLTEVRSRLLRGFHLFGA